MVLCDFNGQVLMNGAGACFNDHPDAETIDCLQNDCKNPMKGLTDIVAGVYKILGY